MRNRLFVLGAVCMATAVFAVPAMAGVDQNPNVFEATDLSCANGLESDELLIVGRTGHTADGFAGVATSVHVLMGSGGAVVFTVFDVPGQGLDGVTVWCEWREGATWFGGDILLPGHLR